MKLIHWDKFRILVTNKCNYRCPFCHNEGQDKECYIEMMRSADLYIFIDMIKDLPISEFNFSGGEPFMNSDIAEMIEYASQHLTCDISCATNLSLITEEQIARLAKTRVKFNIQFPYITETDFKISTGNGKLQRILQNIELVRKYNIKIGLNTVVQNSNINSYRNMILFAIKEELPLKLLPQIETDYSHKYKEALYPILEQYAVEFLDKKSGATRWILEHEGHRTSVLYIDSPCFYRDIAQCKNFSELRIHPDFTIQSCMMKGATDQLELTKGKEYVINQLKQQWINFKDC